MLDRVGPNDVSLEKRVLTEDLNMQISIGKQKLQTLVVSCPLVTMRMLYRCTTLMATQTIYLCVATNSTLSPPVQATVTSSSSFRLHYLPVTHSFPSH